MNPVRNPLNAGNVRVSAAIILGSGLRVEHAIRNTCCRRALVKADARGNLDRGEVNLENARAAPKRHRNAGALCRVRQYRSLQGRVDPLGVIVGIPNIEPGKPAQARKYEKYDQAHRESPRRPASRGLPRHDRNTRRQRGHDPLRT